MSWYYHQSSGNLYNPNGILIAVGYSGEGSGKNVPNMADVPNVGPIPCGAYTINPPIDSPTHGPFAMPLVPNDWNEMFGRSGFMIHGDSMESPGTASKGCIVMPRVAREAIWNSLDRALIVVV